MRHGLTLLGSIVLLSSLSLSAQTVRDAVTIEVVDVPVFVTSSDRPVEGITRDDFELYVNGKLHPIEYFDVLDTAGEPGSLRQRRMFLLLFDLAFSKPESVLRAQHAATELITKAPAGDLFAIATFSSRRSVWFATPFTADRVALARGIRSLMSPQSGDPLGIVMTAAERHTSESVVGPDRAHGSTDPGLDRIAGDAMRDIWRAQFARATEHQLLTFAELAGRLTALQGQKHVVVLSDGYGEDVPALGMSRHYRFLGDMHEAFQSADVLLHTLDLKGVHPLRGSDSLVTLARGTGGQTIYNRNDLGRGLVELTDTYRQGYLLGFRPRNAKRDHNTIEVRVRNAGRGTEVFHRKGFSGTPRSVDVNEGLYLADVVLNDVPQTGTAAELRLEANTLHVRVPLRPLSAQLGDEGGDVELLIYVFGADGAALGFHKKTIEVGPGADGVKRFEVALPDGAQVAKALLRVDDSLGFSRTGP